METLIWNRAVRPAKGNIIRMSGVSLWKVLLRNGELGWEALASSVITQLCEEHQRSPNGLLLKLKCGQWQIYSNTDIININILRVAKDNLLGTKGNS